MDKQKNIYANNQVVIEGEVLTDVLHDDIIYNEYSKSTSYYTFMLKSKLYKKERDMEIRIIGVYDKLKDIQKGDKVQVRGQIQFFNDDEFKRGQKTVYYVFALEIKKIDNISLIYNMGYVCGKVVKKPYYREIKNVKILDTIIEAYRYLGNEKIKDYVHVVFYNNAAEKLKNIQIGMYLEVFGNLTIRKFYRILKDNKYDCFEYQLNGIKIVILKKEKLNNIQEIQIKDKTFYIRTDAMKHFLEEYKNRRKDS